MKAIRYMGYAAYCFGAAALLNAIVFLAWGSYPYFPVYTAWAIFIGFAFYFTRDLRMDAEIEAEAKQIIVHEEAQRISAEREQEVKVETPA